MSALTAHSVQVLVVDDHPIVRHGIAQLVGHEPDFSPCLEAADSQTALQAIDSHHPELVIVDLSLENENGLELIDQIKTRWPDIKILVCSNHEDRFYAGRALRAGASGYLCKREALTHVVAAVRQVLRGEKYLSAEVAEQLAQAASGRFPADRDPVESLSNREIQVFGMIGKGLTTAQIAETLSLSSKTVDSHRKVIKMKLKIQTNAQLSRMAYQWLETSGSNRRT